MFEVLGHKWAEIYIYVWQSCVLIIYCCILLSPCCVKSTGLCSTSRTSSSFLTGFLLVKCNVVNKVRYCGCAPMQVNVVSIAMETLKPHMRSLILNQHSSNLTNIDCANKLKTKIFNSISSFQFFSSFTFSEPQNLIFFKISSHVK